MRRLFFGTIILGLAFWFHPWISLGIAVLYSFFTTHKYYELLGLGILLDIMYQTIISIAFLSIPLYTLLSVLIFFAASFIKKRMNIYA